MMKPEDLNNALGEIGDDLIRDADENVPVLMGKKRRPWVKWAAIAAAVLVAAVAVPVAILSRPYKYKAVNGASSGKEAVGGKEEGIEEPMMEPEVSDGKTVRPDLSYKGEFYYEGHPHVAMEDPEMSPKEGDVGDGDFEALTNELPGQLTAGAWDDNAHYLKWKELFEKNGQNNGSGKFEGEYIGEAGKKPFTFWELDSLKRIAVTVLTADGRPAADAEVWLETAAGTITAARTDATGTAYLFGAAEGTLVVRSGTFESSIALEDGAKEVTVTIDESEEKKQVIELMYVVDVTGSMGDELRFLREELGSVIQEVAEANSDARIRLALLFYRDAGDEEEFRYAEFQDVTDPADYEGHFRILRSQDATGGGDYPEALDEALLMAAEKEWTDGATKLIFHVFDAPAHEEAANRDRLKTAISTAAKKGIRILSVLASDADELTEYLARSEAMLTGGQFIFLTNDSGIGNGHLDPGLPDAVHERLNKLMIRLVNGYYTGVFEEPVPWNAE